MTGQAVSIIENKDAWLLWDSYYIERENGDIVTYESSELECIKYCEENNLIINNQ